MPVKLGSKLPPENAEARIEIIPLIDIMFFLLAAFMLVSLSLVSIKSISVNLPTVASTSTDVAKNSANITVNKSGVVFLNENPIGPHELARSLAAWRQTNASLRILISGDVEARHGDVIRVMDLVRSAGIESVAFTVGSSDAVPKP